jgi:hypothetical protein
MREAADELVVIVVAGVSEVSVGVGLSCTIPNGAAGPGNVKPPPKVPIIGST